jgi:hypothetical protein
MARPTKAREIQVQKPAQSLAHFQSKLGQGQEEDGGLLKPILTGFGALVAAGLIYGGWGAWRAQGVEKYEASLAALQLEVEGDGVTPVAAPDMEKRMRERLPKLESLVASAPSSRKDDAAGLLNTWRLALDGKAPLSAKTADAWGRIRLAQRALALGQAQEARTQLEPLRAKALPAEPWAEAYWTSQVDMDRLTGDRAQALKDLAEYRARFKGRSDGAELERMLQSI